MELWCFPLTPALSCQIIFLYYNKISVSCSVKQRIKINTSLINLLGHQFELPIYIKIIWDVRQQSFFVFEKLSRKPKYNCILPAFYFHRAWAQFPQEYQNWEHNLEPLKELLRTCNWVMLLLATVIQTEVS